MHAPLPYSVEGEGQRIVGILSIDNHYAAFLKGRAKESQDATAAFIVRACNSHYELVEALTELAEYAAAEIGLQVQDCVAGPIGKARNALAKAKGE